MAKRKRTEPVPKPETFRTTPFSSLKGVVTAVQPPPPRPERKAPPAEAVDDDKDLFLTAMSDVRKLGGEPAGRLKPPSLAPHGRSPAPPSPPAVDKVSGELFLEEIKRLKLDVKFSDNVPDEDELKPLAGNRLKQLKRGIITLDRQLDLHGLTRDEALLELPRFLRNAQHKGCAAVLVITGKGINSPGEPVLQQTVSSWLRDAGRNLVLEFTPAPRELGGSGAFVVFLRNAQKPTGAT